MESIYGVAAAQLEAHFSKDVSKLLGQFVLDGLFEQVVPILSLLIANSRMLPFQPFDLCFLLDCLPFHKLNGQHILKLQLFQHILKQLHKFVLAINEASLLQLCRNT